MQLPHFDVHDGNGPPCLLVHGFLSSRAQWQPNLDAIATVVKPVTVELYGHGRSPTPADAESYTPAGYMRAFDAIRRELGARRIVLCGYSLGAGLTIRYAIERPEAVIGHVFTNSASGFADAAAQARFRSGAPGIVERFVDGGRAMIDLIGVHPRNAKRLPSALHAALCADADLTTPLGVGMTIAYTNAGASVRDLIHANSVPALLCCGRHEKSFRPQRDHAVAHMPHLEIVDLDAGHAVNMEAADAFNASFVDFVARAIAVLPEA